MKAKKWSRAIIDETIANGFSSPLYKGEYEFWFHVLAQCKVILTDDVDLAGVNFKSTKYCLYINPEKFDELPLNQRLGVLKHEMMHILYNHLSRKELRQHKPWNVACDCAINQQIKSEDLPDGCITPKSLEKALKDNGHNTKNKIADFLEKNPKEIQKIRNKSFNNISELCLFLGI